jgi:hypothetical protein
MALLTTKPVEMQSFHSGAERAAGQEGVVAKRLDSMYEPGSRSDAWRKMRLNQAQEFVIGGHGWWQELRRGDLWLLRGPASSGTSGERATASRRRLGSNFLDGSAGWRSRRAHSQTGARLSFRGAII